MSNFKASEMKILILYNEKRWPCPGDQVLGFLPGTDKHGADIQHLSLHWLFLLLFPGHQANYIPWGCDKEEESKPFKIEEESEKKRGVPEKENRSFFWQRKWSFQVWRMWKFLQIWKWFEDPYGEITQESEHTAFPWENKESTRGLANGFFSEYFSYKGHSQGGIRGAGSRGERGRGVPFYRCSFQNLVSLAWGWRKAQVPLLERRKLQKPQMSAGEGKGEQRMGCSRILWQLWRKQKQLWMWSRPGVAYSESGQSTNSLASLDASRKMPLQQNCEKELFKMCSFF